MKIYRIPIIFALITLFTSLLYTQLVVGFAEQRPYNNSMDIYTSYADNLTSGFGYGNCVVGSDFLCVESGPERVLNRAYRLPIYPFFIALIMSVFGTSQFLPVLLLVQSVLAALMVFIITGLVQKYDTRAAIIAGIIFGITKPLYYLASRPLTEILFTLILILFSIALQRSSKKYHFLFVGILLGVAMLTRGVLVPTVLLLWFLIREKKNYFIMLIGATLIIFPWTLRNYIVFDSFVPFSTGIGDVLYGSSHPEVIATVPGSWRSPLSLSGSEAFEGLGELEKNHALQQSSIAYLRSFDIHTLISIFIFRILGFWGLYDAFFSKLGLLIFIGILIFILIKSIYNRNFRYSILQLWHNPMVKISLILLIGAMLNSIIFWANYRFLFPYMPYIAFLGGLGGIQLFKDV